MKWIWSFSAFSANLAESIVSETALPQLSQNTGLGNQFTDDLYQKYLEYKKDPSVYWAVYDIGTKRFIAESGSSGQANILPSKAAPASTSAMQKLADQLQSSIAGMGTDEELLTKLVTSIKSVAELAELNRIMRANPGKYEYSSVVDLVDSELGAFDQESKAAIDNHFRPLVQQLKSQISQAQRTPNSPSGGGDSKKNVYAASVSKAVTAAAALNQHNGNLPNAGDLDKLKAFLVKSDNGVWNHFTNLAGGWEKVNSWAKSMGWSMLPGRRSGGNLINAHDMCLFWSAVLNRSFPGAEIIEKMSNACATSSGRSRKYIPSNCRIGGKTGLYQKSMHDSAWIVSPTGRFSIVVLTELASAPIVATMFGGLFKEYCK